MEAMETTHACEKCGDPVDGPLVEERVEAICPCDEGGSCVFVRLENVSVPIRSTRKV